MKTLLGSLLVLALLVAGTYATAPVWLPHVLASRLPPGWQLVQMDAGYPGLCSMRIKSLSLSAALPLAGLTVSADDILFDYRTRATEIGSVALEVALAMEAEALPHLDQEDRGE